MSKPNALFIILAIDEDHSKDTFSLFPFRICDSEESALQVADEDTGHARFAVVMVDLNKSFNFDELPDSWKKDVNREGVQFIFYDKRG